MSSALALSILTTSVAEARPVELAHFTAEGMAASRDELIWSANFPMWWPGYGTNAAELWRKNKSGAPESERFIYREERATALSFGSVAYVSVANVEYAYFVANYDDTITYIKRVPLSGGPATIVTRAPFIGGRDLKSDGAFLYWADSEGVRRIPLGGGTITTLHRTNKASQVALDANYVYFGIGAAIHRVLKGGGAVTMQASTWDPVTDLFIHEAAGQTTMYWADAKASVASQVAGSTIMNVHQPAVEDMTGTSVAFDGARVLWTQCAVRNTSECQVREIEEGATLTVLSSQSEYRNLIADAGQLFWSRRDAIMKYVHTAPPVVAIDPAQIVAFREGRGSITRYASPVVSLGDPPFLFDWRIDNAAFRVGYGEQGRRVSVFAALAACDTLEAQLKVTVIDAIGRRVPATADVTYTATRPVGGVCD